MKLSIALVLFAVGILPAEELSHSDWAPAPSPLVTRWAKEVNPQNVHPEYPRPQIVRKEWLSLNGLWDYAITDETSNHPKVFDGQILVPFPVETPLSGVGRTIDSTNELWYQRSFVVPSNWRGQRIWLRLGAVDWECTVWVNGTEIGTHRGGYDSFGFDITLALKPDGGQEVRLRVRDRLNDGRQVVGKQSRIPKGTFYSRVSGIWQTVWLEPVPEAHLLRLKTVPFLDKGAVEFVALLGDSASNTVVEADVLAGGEKMHSARAVAELSTNLNTFVANLSVSIPEVKPWSPSNPFLYDALIRVIQDDKTVDEVETYFGMREVGLKEVRQERWRITHNDEPLFQLGVLDEGYWPDGLYAAPTDEALRYDIEMAKKLGFNMIRKHMKVEPERWYYWCDKLGMLVWQDMPKGHAGSTKDKPHSSEAAEQFEVELQRMVEGRFNHPSIVGWILFNQEWAQFDTVRLTEELERLDPSRLVISASGWDDFGIGDVDSLHFYPPPPVIEVDPKRALMLGEFGGFGADIAGHMWTDRGWSHLPLPEAKLLTREYQRAMRQVAAFRSGAELSASVFTQLTDVEQETTGLMTYDREVLKIDADVIIKANQEVQGEGRRGRRGGVR